MVTSQRESSSREASRGAHGQPPSTRLFISHNEEDCIRSAQTVAGARRLPGCTWSVMSLSISDTIRCAKLRGLWALNRTGGVTAGCGKALEVLGGEHCVSGERQDTEHLVQSLIGHIANYHIRFYASSECAIPKPRCAMLQLIF